MMELSRRHLAMILALSIVIGAGLIRFHDLAAKSLWFDEILTAHAARIETLGELGAWIDRWIDHPPFQMLLTWLLRGSGGDEFTVRLPVAIAGTLAVGAIYALASAMFRPSIGILAAAFLSTMAYAVWYSQEARPYAFVLLWTILQMLFAFRAAERDRTRDWVAFSAFSILNLYTSYLALATTAAAAVFMAAVALIWAGRNRQVAAPTKRFAPVIDQAFARRGAIAFVAIATAYAVWIPHLVDFLSRPDLGFGRIDTAHAVTLDEVARLLGSLSLGGGASIVLMTIGCAGLLVDTKMHRSLAATLLASWLLVGLGGLILRTGGGFVTVWPRYFIYLVPAGVLLAAAGAEYVGRAAERASPRSVARMARWIALSALAILLLAPAPRALADLYSTQKGDDYRGAAVWLATRSSERPIVISAGEHPDRLVLGLSHELWVSAAPIQVIDGGHLDAAGFEALASAGSLVVATTPNQDVSEPPSGWIRQRVPGIDLIDVPIGNASSLDLAITGLRWAMPVHPNVAASIALISAVEGSGEDRATALTGSSNAAAGWSLPPGWALNRAGSLKVVGHGAQLDAVKDVSTIGTPSRLALTFTCRSSMAGGSVRLYVSAHAADGAWLAILPTGEGYRCPSSPGGQKGGFGIDIPSGTDHLSVRVRSDGVGDGEVRDLRLVPLPDE